MSTIVDSARGPKDQAAKLTLSSVFSAIGSLKFTVVLFALSLVTVLVGTLAQDEMNMFEVKQRYFTCWFTQLYFDDFFPQAFYPHENPIRGSIPFPGGALIGLLLMINLVAAKATRFRVSGKGPQLLSGVGLIAMGSLLACVVVAAGNSSEGLQGTPPISYASLWASVLASLTIMAFGFLYAGTKVSQSTIKILAFGFAALLGVFVVYALVEDFRIGDPGLRIVGRGQSRISKSSYHTGNDGRLREDDIECDRRLCHRRSSCRARGIPSRRILRTGNRRHGYLCSEESRSRYSTSQIPGSSPECLPGE